MTASPARATQPLVVCVAILLAAHLLLGLAHIASLPPWEGFDETGHFSSIQQLADTGTVPRLPDARFSSTVEDYRLVAPVAFASNVPFDENGGLTYVRFFAAGVDRSAAVAAVHLPPASPRQFVPSNTSNYIAQHPPLFPAAMAPLYVWTRTLTLGAQLFVLRASAYFLAWLALVVGVVVAWRHLPEMPHRDVAIVVAAVWPLALPSWFPSMARLGNDSLVALIVALLWWWMVAWGMRTYRSAIVVGVLLGAGALTKAFMIPIAIGTIGSVLAQSWRLSPQERGAAAARAALAASVALLIAGWWYVGPSALAVAGPESIALEALGGLGPALHQYFSLSGYGAGIGAFVGMAIWSGTWSLARPPYYFFVPLIVTVVSAAVWFVALARREPAEMWRLPMWWLGPMLVGFAYHILVHVAITGSGRGVGGYYLNVLVAPLATATGLVVARLWRRARIVVALHFTYAAMFAAAAAWAQLLLFAGLLDKGDDKFYAARGPLPSWLGVPEALARLQTLAFPAAATVLAVAGVLLLAVGLIGVRSTSRQVVAN